MLAIISILHLCERPRRTPDLHRLDVVRLAMPHVLGLTPTLITISQGARALPSRLHPLKILREKHVLIILFESRSLLLFLICTFTEKESSLLPQSD